MRIKMKNKKIIGSLIVVVFIIMILSGIASPNALIQDSSPKTSQGEFDDLIPINFSIEIGDINIGDNNPNWSYYVNNYDWATGNGTEGNPYIIEGIHVTNENQTAHISIEKAEYFIIRNVTVSNYAKPYGHHIFAGIYIGKGEYGLIDNVTIINCSHGISLAEAKDSIKITNSRFIGSHNDPDTGLGAAILIHEAKGVEITYNDIFNFYNGIVVYDAEDILIENNTIETSFGYISDTGIYFYTVGNSEIINNDFYGCNFTGHEYDDPFTSSGFEGLKISLLENCYNLTIYGNKFYDLEGNLIEGSDIPDIPDDIPDDLTIVPPIWIYIVIVVIVIVVVSVFLFLRKIRKS